MPPDVSALYIDDIHGPYPSLLSPDLVWSIGRDACTYAGPHPIVAHPPCGPWGRMSAWAYATDRELALIAVRQLREWGGVSWNTPKALAYGARHSWISRADLRLS